MVKMKKMNKVKPPLYNLLFNSQMFKDLQDLGMDTSFVPSTYLSDIFTFFNQVLDILYYISSYIAVIH